MMASAFTLTMILMQLAIAFCYEQDHALARGSPDGIFSGSTDPPPSVAHGFSIETSHDI